MRPRRYPYSGKIKKPINFQIDSEEFKRLSYEAVHDTSSIVFSGRKVTIKGQSITGV
nr:MAG TPA: hypothetical protein [Caudoviricetes sp.]